MGVFNGILPTKVSVQGQAPGAGQKVPKIFNHKCLTLVKFVVCRPAGTSNTI